MEKNFLVNFNNYSYKDKFYTRRKIAFDNLEKINSIYDFLIAKMAGQEHVVEILLNAIRRSITGLKEKNKTMGAFIFCGPTGVGKTEMAKTLAEMLFGSELVRVDMSEFTDSTSASKLLGTAPGFVGFDEGGLFSKKRKAGFENCVILFDEIEKAFSGIFDVLLQLLDEGFIHDGHGQKISFKNSLIILTSNIGSININNFLAKTNVLNDVTLNELSKIIKAELLKEFRPEFINRLDDIIIFKPLTKENAKSILVRLLGEKLQMLKESFGFNFFLEPIVIDFLLEQGYSKEFGARQIKRILNTVFDSAVIRFLSVQDNITVNDARICISNDSIQIKA